MSWHVLLFRFACLNGIPWINQRLLADVITLWSLKMFIQFWCSRDRDYISLFVFNACCYRLRPVLFARILGTRSSLSIILVIHTGLCFRAGMIISPVFTTSRFEKADMLWNWKAGSSSYLPLKCYFFFYLWMWVFNGLHERRQFFSAAPGWHVPRKVTFSNFALQAWFGRAAAKCI